MGRNRIVLASMALALIAAACGGDDEPAETTTAAPVTIVAPDTTTTIAVTTTTAAATTTTTTTTLVPVVAAPAGSMLITNEDGVYVATPDAVVAQLLVASPAAVGGIVDFAIDDTRGGIVVQPHRSPWEFLGVESIVYWAPRGASDLQQLLVPADDQGLQLEDVAPHGDAVVAYYTRRSGTLPDTAEQTLRGFDLDAKTVAEIAVVGGWESGTSPISVGGETIVRNGSGEAISWITFSDLANNVFEPPANPLVDGDMCVPECFWYADLSPDGSLVAFGRLAPNAGGFPSIPEIEIRSVATGELVLSATLPALAASGYIDSLDMSDTHVLINLVEEGSVVPSATVVEIASGVISAQPAPVGGIARFLRSAPDLGGVLSWP